MKIKLLMAKKSDQRSVKLEPDFFIGDDLQRPNSLAIISDEDIML